MRKLGLVAVLIAASPMAMAGNVSSTFTLASDYLFDGASQTQGDPAFQASLDWTGTSGFYFGTWFSNVDFGQDDPADSEVDFYGGYSWEAEGNWAFSGGLLHYTYNGASDYNYTELTGSVTVPFGTKFQAWFADDEDVFGGSAYRIKAKHSFALPAKLSLDLELTRTEYSNSRRYDDGSLWFQDFTHGQIGVSRAFGPVTAYLGYSDTDDSHNSARDGTLLFTLSTTMDWFHY